MQETIAGLPVTITPLHAERGRAMRAIVQDDFLRYGRSFEESVEQLADYLGIPALAVKLAIAIANEADRVPEVAS